MREILFRAKAAHTIDHEWLYGYVCVDSYLPEGIMIICESEDGSVGGETAIAETVGQFTGLTDKNGKQIFEGDIIKSDNGKTAAVSVVKFGEYYPKMFYRMLDMFSPGRKHLPAVGFYCKSVDKGEEMIPFQSPCVTVIGNIHDNPELLEDQQHKHIPDGGKN